jgi:hypothetical protein
MKQMRQNLLQYVAFGERKSNAFGMKMMRVQKNLSLIMMHCKHTHLCFGQGKISLHNGF